MESLVGQQLDNAMQDMSAYFTDASPVRGSLIAQDVLELVLRAHAEKMGGNLRYGTEMLAFEQDEEGIKATIRESWRIEPISASSCQLSGRSELGGIPKMMEMFVRQTAVKEMIEVLSWFLIRLRVCILKKPGTLWLCASLVAMMSSWKMSIFLQTPLLIIESN